MKAKEGFVLRCVVDEYIIMPTTENIDQFDGSVVLNGVSAFTWEKLQQDTTRDALLKALLDEYEVTEDVAERELDNMLRRFLEYGLITP